MKTTEAVHSRDLMLKKLSSSKNAFIPARAQRQLRKRLENGT